MARAKWYVSGSPSVFQVAEDDQVQSKRGRTLARIVVQELQGFRFLDPSPSQMRIPSLPGQTTLGDRGENLSSVLAVATHDPAQKRVVLEWVAQLHPDGCG